MRALAATISTLCACGHSADAPRDATAEAGAADAPAADAMADALPPRCTPRAGTQVVTTQVATVPNAVLVTSPPYDPRLFVVDQIGNIRIIENDVLLPTPFLQITRGMTNLDAGGEQGLLGLAFDPAYAQNGQFYVFYTTTELTPVVAHFTVLARYHVSADPDVADPLTGEVLLRLPHAGRVHNAGMIEFGADRLLYISTGDGGGGSSATAQDPTSLNGKLLRIDVSGTSPGKPYRIPPGNAYPGGVGGAPEILHLGFRNPWRWSFDRKTSDLYVADVGEDTTEELNILPAALPAGGNFGWFPIEGNGCASPPCDFTGKTAPQLTRSHAPDGWCAIVGGQVYRGPCMPDLDGTYFLSDYCAGGLWTLKAQAGVITTPLASLPGTFPLAPSSIHADERGELYLTATAGGVYHLELAP